MELFIHVAEQLGFSSDRDLADLAGATVENVANWRKGNVQEFKTTKLQTIKDNLSAHINALMEQSGRVSGRAPLLCPLEIEEGSSPTDLQRQFRERIAYDYLGHRFLYYEPMGALAWESLIKRGYDQDRWLRGVERCAHAWLDGTKDSDGRCKGPLAEALGWGRKNARGGFDVVSLGPGDGAKERRVLEVLLERAGQVEQKLSWLAYAPVDVSIPLLLTAARNARTLFEAATTNVGRAVLLVKPFVADFEESNLAFIERLPTEIHSGQSSLRLVTMLGNTFGNVLDEDEFVRHKLVRLLRPGDLAWIEVGLKFDRIENDPLFRMTEPDGPVTAAETNRTLLLEGPYRRWESATGRRPADLDLRVWVREDDESCRIPGSYNFCHDLVIKDERRACTMLHSRRYDLESLTGWFESRSFSVERINKVEDSKKRARVAHLLLKRH